MAQRGDSRKILNRSLMHVAARLHYLDGLSQLEVARKLNISTASVSRVLARAREEGIVRIQVADLIEADAIGNELCAALNLRAASVGEGGRMLGLSARLNEILLAAEVPPKPVIAIGWGRAVQTAISDGLPSLPECLVVPCIGGMNETASYFQINEFVRIAAGSAGGDALFLHAPSMISPELRSVLLSDNGTSKIIDCWTRVDVAVLGIGLFGATAHPVQLDFGERDRGCVVGDVARHYFDIEGQEVPWIGQERLMAMSRSEFQRIPLSIGIATGREKTSAIIGAVRSGMINALITDIATANAILEDLWGVSSN